MSRYILSTLVSFLHLYHAHTRALLLVKKVDEVSSETCIVQNEASRDLLENYSLPAGSTEILNNNYSTIAAVISGPGILKLLQERIRHVGPQFASLIQYMFFLFIFGAIGAILFTGSAVSVEDWERLVTLRVTAWPYQNQNGGR